MPSSPLASLRRALRSPWTITAELAGVALAGLAATQLDQHPSPTARVRFALEHPLLGPAVQALGLDRIFTSVPFLLVVGLASASLLVVAWEQWGRLRREWPAPRETAFRSAPFRRELVRAATGAAPGPRITCRGRLGDLGSPLFHLGLLLVTLAGVVRMLFGAAATREAIEGDPWPQGASAFQRQDLGPLAGPVELPWPVRLGELRPAYYPSGQLQGLSAGLAVEGGSGGAELAINAPARVGETDLYLTQQFGPAVLFEVPGPGGAELHAAPLSLGEGPDYQWSGTLLDGRELRLRAPLEARAARPPQVVEARLLSGTTLLAAGRLEPGAVLKAPGGDLTFRGARWWVKVEATRDPSTWQAYLGFALALVGVILMFGVIRTDELVAVEPLPPAEGRPPQERVVVALRARRLAPLFAERFEALVRREHGGG